MYQETGGEPTSEAAADRSQEVVAADGTIESEMYDSVEESMVGDALQMRPIDPAGAPLGHQTGSEQASSMHLEKVEFQTNVEDYVSLRESIAKQLQSLKGERAQFKQAEKAIISFLQCKGMTSFDIGGVYRVSIKKRARKGPLKKEMIASTLRQIVPPDQVHGIIQTMEMQREVSESISLHTSTKKK